MCDRSMLTLIVAEPGPPQTFRAFILPPDQGAHLRVRGAK
jgi:hypothetical protein